MLKLIKNFMKEEEGGADQLVVAAILVVVGIGVAVLFGKNIVDFVTGLFVKKDVNQLNQELGIPSSK